MNTHRPKRACRRLPGSQRTLHLGQRHGISLLETMMALSLAALLMAPVVGMLQTSRELWESSDSDRTQLDALHGTLRHLSRNLKAADSLLALDTKPGRRALLQIRGRNGQVQRWTHDARSGQIVFHDGRTSGILADNIAALQFEGFTASGQRTIIPAAVSTIRCTATVDLKRKRNATETSHCTVWIRPQL